MRTPSFRRTTVLLLLLAAVLAAPPAFAAGRPAEGVSLAPLETLWSFLRAAWTKDGCHLDLNGLCTTSPPPPQTKESCGIDPSGGCKPGTASPPTIQTKTTCNIDPNGQCKP